MEKQWYYRANNEVLGPVTSGEISGLIRRGALGTADRVRRGTAGSWLTVAAAVAAFFPEANAQTAADAAARLLRDASRVRLGKAGEPRFGIFRFFEPFRIRCGAVMRAICSAFQGSAEAVANRCGRRSVVVVAAIIAGPGAVWLLCNSPVTDRSVDESLERVAAIWQAARSDRGGTRDAAAWDRFAEGSTTEIEQIAADLEAASARPSGVWEMVFGEDELTEYARRDVLHVARYDLPAALRSNPHAPVAPDLEARIDESLRGARGMLAAAGHAPASRRFLRAAEQSSFKKLALGGLIAADAALVVAGALMWCRRRPTEV